MTEEEVAVDVVTARKRLADIIKSGRRVPISRYGKIVAYIVPAGEEDVPLSVPFHTVPSAGNARQRRQAAVDVLLKKVNKG